MQPVHILFAVAAKREKKTVGREHHNLGSASLSFKTMMMKVLLLQDQTGQQCRQQQC